MLKPSKQYVKAQAARAANDVLGMRRRTVAMAFV